MNPAQIKCLLVFSLFAIIGFGPISPGCLIGFYVVTKRPSWFLDLANNLYRDKPSSYSNTEDQAKKTRKKCFFSLLTLFIIDIAPVPVTPVIAFIIILFRPHWFYCTIKAVYSY